MKLTFRPIGRGNWHVLVLQVLEGSALLFPALRDGPPALGETWVIQGRSWRLVRIDL